jgi:hypothetical protein
LALELLRDPAFDALLTGESRFDELPDVMSRLAAGTLPALCHSIRYPEKSHPGSPENSYPESPGNSDSESPENSYPESPGNSDSESPENSYPENAER